MSRELALHRTPVAQAKETRKQLLFKHKLMILWELWERTLRRWRREERGWTLCRTRQAGLYFRCSWYCVWLEVKHRTNRISSFLFPPDNLAVSAQGFRRGANRVRKVCSLYITLVISNPIIHTCCRICGTWIPCDCLSQNNKRSAWRLGGKTWRCVVSSFLFRSI